MPSFAEGPRVLRKEDRASRGATIMVPATANLSTASPMTRAAKAGGPRTRWRRNPRDTAKQTCVASPHGTRTQGSRPCFEAAFAPHPYLLPLWEKVPERSEGG